MLIGGLDLPHRDLVFRVRERSFCTPDDTVLINSSVILMQNILGFVFNAPLSVVHSPYFVSFD